jgi:hypothetical protein
MCPAGSAASRLLTLTDKEELLSVGPFVAQKVVTLEIPLEAVAASSVPRNGSTSSPASSSSSSANSAVSRAADSAVGAVRSVSLLLVPSSEAPAEAKFKIEGFLCFLFAFVLD